jgi:polysaccharide deacetylase family protein (PEP-CTERM system associated)
VINSFTVDVEDYFQVSAFDDVIPRDSWDSLPGRVVANTHRLLALLDDFGVRGTFFVLGWVADRYPSLVRDIALAGHELASHGYAHRLVYDQTPAAFREDVRRAKKTIEDHGGQRVRGYRAPSFSIVRRSLGALDVLVEEGYDYDSSIFPVRHDRYGIPDAPRHPHVRTTQAGPIVEAPPATVKMGRMHLPVAGGGYFRLFPYGWTKWGISRINRQEAQPAVFYIHPWELDDSQPRLPARALSRFRHYRNLHKTSPRLRRLLTDFKFGPLGTCLDRIGATAPPAPSGVRV